MALDFAATALPDAAAPSRIPASRTAQEPAADRVRPCEARDLGAVAELFQLVFRKDASAPPRDLIDHLDAVYFLHPWHNAATPSLVLERADGTLDGFIGVLPLRLIFRGKPIVATIAGALMVRDPEQRPLAASRLMRAHVSGPQYVSLGDTTNHPAQTMWERLGGHQLPLASMEWLKIIRWVPFGVSSGVSRLPQRFRSLLKPVAAGVEWLSWTLGPKLVPNANETIGETVDDAAYLAAAGQISQNFDLRLDPDPEAGLWLLRMAAEKRKYGALHRRIVRSRNGRPVGTYLVYFRRGMPAETLQIVSHPKSSEAVLADLIAYAAAQGCTAVRGRTQGPMIDAFFRAGCLMRHRSATVFRTQDAELAAALENGHTALGGLFGETWTRLVSDDFGASGGNA
ncbi:MAG: hypothetical protein IT548_10430 [Alphaproteobacteria bacterium]|nr:hypothetical protein [Alphaproteobacteria bacterium]